MNTKPCPACQKTVSKSAETCPHCGHRLRRKGMGCGTLIAGFFIIIVISASYSSITTTLSEKPRPSSPAAQKTPQQIEIDKRINVGYVFAKSVKQSMKDPSSFRLQDGYVMSDGSVCLSYRAKNSFGAIVPGKTVLPPSLKALSHSEKGFISLWNKYCTEKAVENTFTAIFNQREN